MTDKKWQVLVVDDEPSNLQLMMQILGDRYHMAYATSGDEALTAARKLKPDLILLDIMMPEMDGYETCLKFKADPATTKIPVIFVTAMGEEEDESRGFEVGGVDYVTKPVSVPVVLARVATHIALYNQHRACEITIEERTAELAASQQSAIHMLGEAGHYNDTDTGVHIWRMGAIAEAIARACGWRADQAKTLKLAAAMHDTGKIGIPDAILKKPGKLDEEEWRIMKMHPGIGHGILCKCDTPLFRMATDIARYHHEKWDGSGYPEGLKGEAIPESARIVAISDVFDALTMKRPYKEAWPIEKALKLIHDTVGSHFDPSLTESFFRIETEIRETKEKWDRKEKS